MHQQTFFNCLAERLEKQIDRAVAIATFLKIVEGQPATSVREIEDYFEKAGLARPNRTRLASLIGKDRRVSIRYGQVRALVSAEQMFRENFPELLSENDQIALPETTLARLTATPLITAGHIAQMIKMLELYAGLNVLENSMRGLIEGVLNHHLGRDWWDQAASGPMKRKHGDRLEKETTKRWLPARTEFGPLYSIDWPDLVSIMRKYEGFFVPIIGHIDFLHRFADLGNLRNVVAHNGLIDDETQFSRVQLHLSDWQNQISNNMPDYLKK